MPMSSRKTFATNSQKLIFWWNVWFLSQIVYSKVEHPWIINKMNIENYDFIYVVQKNQNIFTDTITRGIMFDSF